MSNYIVLENWIESCENPIVLKRGDRVSVDLSVKDPDAEWANWVWCTSAVRTTGWVPTQILKVVVTRPDNTQEAVANEDYSACELSVEKDDIVLGERILNGWLWCRKQDSGQEGWVPLRNVEPITESN